MYVYVCVCVHVYVCVKVKEIHSIQNQVNFQTQLILIKGNRGTSPFTQLSTHHEPKE
jgi:hypothetical protein